MGRYIVTRSDGKPIPEDEPCFIIRGQDAFAVRAVQAYIELVSDVVSFDVMSELVAHQGRLARWRLDHPVKLPD